MARGKLTGTRLNFPAREPRWVTGPWQATSPACPSNRTLPMFTGHFAIWFGVSGNDKNLVNHSIMNVVATGSDGSAFTFHEPIHISVSATGVAVSFDKPVCG